MIDQKLNEATLHILRKLCKTGDQEMDHVRADDALCDLLRSLGYDDVVDAFEAVGKWYA